MSLQEKFLERQLAAYERVMEKISDFELLAGEGKERRDFGTRVTNALVEILSAFERGFMFFDNATFKMFDERIFSAFFNHEFDVFLKNKEYASWYDELNRRLSGEILGSMRDFFQHKFPELYEPL